MKQRNATEPAVPRPHEWPMQVLMEAFPNLAVLSDEEARAHTADLARRIEQASAAGIEQERYDTAKALWHVAARLVRQQRSNPNMEQRRYHVFTCGKCSDPFLMSSSKGGHTVKSSLRGGCATCAGVKRGSRSGGAVVNESFVFEVIVEEEL